MSKKEMIKRYVVFAFGVFFTAFGIIFMTKAGLGTSTLASLPYVCSFILPVSLGVCLFAINLIYISLQVLITKGKLPKIQYLQLVVALVFSFCMDSINWLLAFEPPASYIMKLVIVVVGCVITALGVSLELQANVLILPAEGLVREFAKWRKMNQGTVKLMQDCLLVVLAVIVSLLYFKELHGVREGTVIAALILGPMVKFYNRRFAFMNKSFFPDSVIKETKEME